MQLVLFFLAAVLVIDTLLKGWQRRRRLLGSPTNRVTSGAAALLSMGGIGRMLAIMRLLVETSWWVVVIGYIVLLIWSFAIGPVKPIHEWFTH
jgi:hypothetical protein